MKFNTLQHFTDTWRNSGIDPLTRDRVTVKDMMNFKGSEAPEFKDMIGEYNGGAWMPYTITRIVKEAAEPYLIGTSLLDRIAYTAGAQITFPAAGALVAYDLAPGQGYPEQELSIGGSAVTASTGKVGLKFRITEEMIKHSQFDVISMHVRQAGYGLARRKENKIFNFIRGLGAPCFDNLNPTSSYFGTTSGRALDGTPNGSLIMDDIIDAMAQIINQGFMPNVMLVHPLTYMMWMKDPVMRQFALSAGGGAFFQKWQGRANEKPDWSNGPMGARGPSAGRTIVPTDNPSMTPSEVLEYSQRIDSRPVIPPYFGFPLTILSSPFIPFDAANKLTDIYLFEAGQLGALIVEEDMAVDEWEEKETEVRNVKIRERYGIGIYHEGQAIAVLKNIHCVDNQIVLPAQASATVYSGAAGITTINHFTPITL